MRATQKTFVPSHRRGSLPPAAHVGGQNIENAVILWNSLAGAEIYEVFSPLRVLLWRTPQTPLDCFWKTDRYTLPFYQAPDHGRDSGSQALPGESQGLYPFSRKGWASDSPLRLFPNVFSEIWCRDGSIGRS
jgi:hypothetical protein